MEKRKVAILLGLAGMALGTIAAGIYFKHYFVVFVFGVWVGIEFLLWRVPTLLGVDSKGLLNKGRFAGFTYLLDLYSRFDESAVALLEERIFQLKIEGRLSEYEQRWLDRMRDLMQLRALVFGKPEVGKKGLRQAFAFRKQVQSFPDAGRFQEDDLGLQNITEGATVMADLYWKLYEACLGGYTELTRTAHRLYFDIFGTHFEKDTSRPVLEKLIDSMQRDRGLPFLILNLIRRGETARARQIAQLCLTSGQDLEEEVRSSIYWICEIYWFAKEGKTILTDYESSVRYLYHICFTNPERAGFLEIDSQFFSQFETISELAQEGFLFRETLIEKILSIWREHEGQFDGVFQGVLEAMTRKKSKIYDERENWELFWAREAENFSRDYLYVVEGNLCYAARHYQDAKNCYEKALRLSPKLRPALLNILFCYAKLGLVVEHEKRVQALMTDKSLLPSSLFVIGNSYLVLGNEKKTDFYYDQLKRYEGWERKTEYYKSTFCYENGLYEKALEFARKAHEQNPTDSSMNYHLSLCYNAVGEKDQALDMVKRVGEAPQWLDYYRFTLERDAGHHDEASETLLRIPSDHMEPEELEAAVDFARGRQDLGLLRHLRKKDS